MFAAIAISRAITPPSWRPAALSEQNLDQARRHAAIWPASLFFLRNWPRGRSVFTIRHGQLF
jgi:hypothetical protein